MDYTTGKKKNTSYFSQYATGKTPQILQSALQAKTSQILSGYMAGKTPQILQILQSTEYASGKYTSNIRKYTIAIALKTPQI